jgi:hypothetical protein
MHADTATFFLNSGPSQDPEEVSNSFSRKVVPLAQEHTRKTVNSGISGFLACFPTTSYQNYHLPCSSKLWHRRLVFLAGIRAS